MFTKEKSFWYLGKIMVISIGMDLSPNQIKLASPSSCFVWFLWSYGGGGGPGNQKWDYMNRICTGDGLRK